MSEHDKTWQAAKAACVGQCTRGILPDADLPAWEPSGEFTPRTTTQHLRDYFANLPCSTTELFVCGHATCKLRVLLHGLSVDSVRFTDSRARWQVKYGGIVDAVVLP